MTSDAGGHVEVDHGPARLSGALSLAAGAVAVAAIGTLGTPLATAGAAAGLPVLLVGVGRGSRRAVSIGSFLTFTGVLAAGIWDAPPEPLLVGAVATVLAWDLGEQAINVGEQLGRAAKTDRGELVHAASATVVGTVAIAVGYGIFHLATGGRPLAALFLLLVAAIALAEAIRE